MKKHGLSRKLIALSMCGALLVSTSAMAGEVKAASNETVSLEDYEQYISSTATTRAAGDNLSVQAFHYMEGSMEEAALSDILNDYHEKAGTREKTYEMFEANLNGTYQEVEANGFSEEQAAQLFQSSSDLETGNAEVTEFTPVEDESIPRPSNGEDIDISSDPTISLLSNSDISYGRDNTDVTGIGYEVKSVPGYNRTTAYFYPGECNIGNVSGGEGGVAAYMFFTLSGAGAANDLGVGYMDGYWQPVVNGHWTGWATGPAHLAAGDKLYFKIWIGTDTQIYFQGIDGDNFNNIIFNGVYTTWNELPPSGSGCTWNRQITYAANAGHQHTGTPYYLNNARFDQAYVYNDYGYAPYNASNTNSNRRGKFGATWAPNNRVTIHSNTHWDSENVSIDVR